MILTFAICFHKCWKIKTRVWTGEPCLKWQMWQFYVLPWVFCELPVPKFQGRKFKFRTNSVNVFPFIPSSRYFKGSKLFPQCKYWLSKPRKRNMPQFWENQLFFPQPTALYWTHCSRTNLRMPKICYLAYFYCLFCE